MTFIKNIPSPLSDDELLKEYKANGDPQVLGELYQRYMDLVYGVCLKYLRGPEDAKDAVLAIYEELVRKLKQHAVVHFKAWLYQVAKNHCLMKLRKQKIIPVNMDMSLMHSSEYFHPEAEVDKEEDYNRMEYCMKQLSGLQRQVIELFYYQHKCYQEIAAIIQTENSIVRSYLQNGRRNLKICMERKTVEQK